MPAPCNINEPQAYRRPDRDDKEHQEKPVFRSAQPARSNNSTSASCSAAILMACSSVMAAPSPAVSDVPLTDTEPRATCTQPVRPAANSCDTLAPLSSNVADSVASWWIATE